MAADFDELLPTASELRRRRALAEAEKEQEARRRREEEREAKRALIARLSMPLGLSDEAAVSMWAGMIRHAVDAGQTEVRVYRFPNELCTDRGRALNYAEPGWEQTLTGVPKELYDLWYRHFRPRGYRLKAYIIEFPCGMPGDVGMSLSWG